jgi:hypothetical protein
LLERKLGDLGAGESDHGSLMEDLGLWFGALATVAEPAEAAELVLGGGEASLGSLEACSRW